MAAATVILEPSQLFLCIAVVTSDLAAALAASLLLLPPAGAPAYQVGAGADEATISTAHQAAARHL
jgi:hypothetical protein